MKSGKGSTTLLVALGALLLVAGMLYAGHIGALPGSDTGQAMAGPGCAVSNDAGCGSSAGCATVKTEGCHGGSSCATAPTEGCGGCPGHAAASEQAADDESAARVNPDECVSCRRCVQVAPEAYEMDPATGKAKVRPDAPADAVARGAAACPTHAVEH